MLAMRVLASQVSYLRRYRHRKQVELLHCMTWAASSLGSSPSCHPCFAKASILLLQHNLPSPTAAWSCLAYCRPCGYLTMRWRSECKSVATTTQTSPPSPVHAHRARKTASSLDLTRNLHRRERDSGQREGERERERAKTKI